MRTRLDLDRRWSAVAICIFAAGLGLDIATKTLMSPVTYYGVIMPSVAWKPVWVIVPAVAAAVLLRSLPVAAAAGMLTAGIVGNLVYTAGVLDFGTFGAWNVADVFCLVGLFGTAALLARRALQIVPRAWAEARERLALT